MGKETKEMAAVRLDPSDKRVLKAIAKRLKVNESDFLRYAIKVALEDFAPLVDQSKEGAQLLGAFLENTDEKSRWLELDRAKLDAILHDGLEDDRLRVAQDDLALLLKGEGGKGYGAWLQKQFTTMPERDAKSLNRGAYLRDKYLEQLRYDAMADEEEERQRREKL